jgi:hypothetical protein
LKSIILSSPEAVQVVLATVVAVELVVIELQRGHLDKTHLLSLPL